MDKEFWVEFLKKFLKKITGKDHQEDLSLTKHEKKVLEEKLSMLEQENKYLEELKDELWDGIEYHDSWYIHLLSSSWIPLNIKIELAQERQKFLTKQCVAGLLSQYTAKQMTTGGFQLPPMLEKSYEPGTTEDRMKQAIMKEFWKETMGAIRKEFQLLQAVSRKIMVKLQRGPVFEEASTSWLFLLNQIAVAGSTQKWLSKIWKTNTEVSMMQTLREMKENLVRIAWENGYREFICYSEDLKAEVMKFCQQKEESYKQNSVLCGTRGKMWSFGPEKKILTIYERTKLNGKLWTKFATQTLGIPGATLRHIRAEVGIPSTLLKIKTLKYWRQKNESNTDGNELKGLVAEFQGWDHNTSEFNNISFNQMVQLVAAMIPNESWLRFVRIQLELDENEIGELKMKYADFTPEQKYQIIKRWMLHGKLQDLGEENWEIRGQEIEDERNTDFPEKIELL